MHSDDPDIFMQSVGMSPHGRVALTRCANSELAPDEEPWSLLHDDVLWDMNTGKSIGDVHEDKLSGPPQQLFALF